jgi:hypothetical protein
MEFDPPSVSVIEEEAKDTLYSKPPTPDTRNVAADTTPAFAPGRTTPATVELPDGDTTTTPPVVELAMMLPNASVLSELMVTG